MADTKESLKSVKDRSYLTKWNGFLIDGKYDWQGLCGLGRYINCVLTVGRVSGKS